MKITTFGTIPIIMTILLLENLLACNEIEVPHLVVEQNTEANTGRTDNESDFPEQDSAGTGDLDTDVDSDVDSDSDADIDSATPIDGGLNIDVVSSPTTHDQTTTDSESDSIANSDDTASSGETDVATDSDTYIDGGNDDFYLPDEMGPYNVEVSKDNLENSSYINDAQLFYPDIVKGKIPAVSIMSGYGLRWPSVNWLSRRIASHGIAVLAVTPNNNTAPSPKNWEIAHKGAIAKLKELAEDKNSPLAGHINVSKLGMIGVSDGGAGAALAADDNVAGVEAVVAVVPFYLDGGLAQGLMKSSSISIPIQYIAGADDSISWDLDVNAAYRATPATTQKQYVVFKGMNHLAPMAGINENVFCKRIANQVISFLQVFLYDDSRYMTYISANGTEFKNNCGWFSDSAATF